MSSAQKLPFEEGDRIRQAERTASRVIEGKAVLVLMDLQLLHTLNPVGTRIWELADGRTLGAIVDQIEAEFEVGRARALEDACRFLTELREVGAVVVEPST
jgi:hypothetical protein